MLLISFWQVLMFLIAFCAIKQVKNEGELGIIHGKARLKLNYMKNPSFGRASKPFPNQSSVQGRKSEKESNTEEFRKPLRNFHKTEGNFAISFSSYEIFASQKKISQLHFSFAKFLQLHFSLAKFSQLLISLTKFSQLHI